MVSKTKPKRRPKPKRANPQPEPEQDIPIIPVFIRVPLTPDVYRTLCIRAAEATPFRKPHKMAAELLTDALTDN